MKLCMRFSWKGLGSYDNMSGTATIVTAPPLHIIEAIEQVNWEMRKEYPLFNFKLTDEPVVTRNRVVPLWKRLLAKWRAGIHFRYLDNRSRDFVIVEVTK